jgi:hypothetical protein
VLNFQESYCIYCIYRQSSWLVGLGGDVMLGARMFVPSHDLHPLVACGGLRMHLSSLMSTGYVLTLQYDIETSYLL